MTNVWTRHGPRLGGKAFGWPGDRVLVRGGLGGEEGRWDGAKRARRRGKGEGARGMGDDNGSVQPREPPHFKTDHLEVHSLCPKEL